MLKPSSRVAMLQQRVDMENDTFPRHTSQNCDERMGNQSSATESVLDLPEGVYPLFIVLYSYLRHKGVTKSTTNPIFGRCRRVGTVLAGSKPSSDKQRPPPENATATVLGSAKTSTQPLRSPPASNTGTSDTEAGVSRHDQARNWRYCLRASTRSQCWTRA